MKFSTREDIEAPVTSLRSVEWDSFQPNFFVVLSPGLAAELPQTWLASVYVAEPHRRRGIGGALVRRVMQEADSLGVETLYLITPDQQRFYAGLGWQAWMPVDYRGERVTIMTYQPTESRKGK